MRSLFHFPLPLHNHPRSNRPTAARNMPSPASCTHAPPAPLPSAAFRRRPPQGPGWQESHCMHPLLAECAKKALFLATSARNVCFSRSRWQHPRPMHPFPGAIGRFRIHGARILPPRALFRVEEPEITHGAKMLPAPPGLSAAAACGPAERALRHATATCDTRHGRTGFAPCSRASPSETRHAVPVPMHLATCAPHPSRQPRGPTASRKQAEQRKQLNAGIKIGSPNGDPIEELFGLRSVCPTPYSPYTKRTNLRFPTWITAPDRDSGATL